MKISCKTIALVAAAPAVLAACASGGPEQRTRGWIGGEYAEVRADSVIGPDVAVDGDRVTGMPVGIGADRGALVLAAPASSPIAAAGLVPGDLLLTVAGRPVGCADDARDAVSGAAPGSAVPVTWWRSGSVRSADVTAGRETWERIGSVRLGLGLSTTLDFWPFDDGIDLLGLVRFRVHDDARDLADVRRAYLAAARPETPVAPDEGRGWSSFLGIAGVGVRERVVEQSPVAR